jgi:hypothetical protein
MSNAPTEDRFFQVFNTIERHIEERYGIPVIIKDVPNPFTGDLDGAEIHVDYEETVDKAVFILAHLFGHTVQWNTSTRAREIGMRVYENPSEELLAELHEYEVEACRYSIRLVHNAGIHDLDEWLSAFSECDFRYLEHFYRTGERAEFLSFWPQETKLLLPKKIPEIHPTKWLSRWEGLVL